MLWWPEAGAENREVGFNGIRVSVLPDGAFWGWMVAMAVPHTCMWCNWTLKSEHSGKLYGMCISQLKQCACFFCRKCYDLARARWSMRKATSCSGGIFWGFITNTAQTIWAPSCTEHFTNFHLTLRTALIQWTALMGYTQTLEYRGTRSLLKVSCRSQVDLRCLCPTQQHTSECLVNISQWCRLREPVPCDEGLSRIYPASLSENLAQAHIKRHGKND